MKHIGAITAALGVRMGEDIPHASWTCCRLLVLLRVA